MRGENVRLLCQLAYAQAWLEAQEEDRRLAEEKTSCKPSQELLELLAVYQEAATPAGFIGEQSN